MLIPCSSTQRTSFEFSGVLKKSNTEKKGIFFSQQPNFHLFSESIFLPFQHSLYLTNILAVPIRAQNNINPAPASTLRLRRLVVFFSLSS
jgi:hypothetical protein